MRFKIDEKEYELRYSFRALRTIEKDLGVKFTEFKNAELESLASLLIIFRAGLLHQNKNITIDEAEGLLEKINFSQDFFMNVMEKFVEDTTAFYTESKGKKKIKNE
ncbi:MAG: hypothetical protein COB02_11780 [Candidatus Cloacimonadota bacterium]|nr:MAG: hypothetical protein COB02_11780 [Candidatus Cloacimonadota bacterium]